MRPFLLFLLSLAGLSLAVVAPVRADDLHHLTANGLDRTYYLHAPPGLPAGAPLVIMLHGAADDGERMVRGVGWPALADSEHFIVAGPNAMLIHPDRPPGGANMRIWNSSASYYPESIAAVDDKGFIVALIDEIARTHAIDRRRVYVAGFSNGGYLANSLGQQIPGKIAAIVTVASDFTPLVKSLPRGMPVLFAAGDSDYFSPIKGGKLTMVWGNVFEKESLRQLVDHWRTLDDCPEPKSSAGPHRTRIEISAPCRDGSEVQYLSMAGVDHQWPTGDPVNLTNIAWTFFKRFSLP
jgi:polyhydroxybutyrate depolymerase